MFKKLALAYTVIVAIAASTLVVSAVVELNTPNDTTAYILKLVKS